MTEKEMIVQLDQAISETGRNMLGLKGEYNRLKEIQADLRMELKKLERPHGK